MTDSGEAMGQMFGVTFSFAAIVLPFAVLYFLIKWAVSSGVVDAGKRGTRTGGRTARQILDERYASGGIGRDEYEQIRRDPGA